MKVAFAVVAVVLAVACAGANAQGSLYYGVEPAPSMAAAMAGAGFTDERGVPVPAAPSMEAIMAGSAPYMMQQQQPYAAPSSFVEAPVPAAAPFATEEAHEEEEDAVEEEAADEEAEEASEEVEEASEDGVDVRFAERKHGKIRGALKKAGKKVKKAAKKVGKAAKKAGKAAAKLAKKAGKAAAKLAKKAAKAAKKAAKKLLKKGKKTFKPKMGKHKNTARSPSAKTPKSAGKKLPPMPAPLPKKFKINCKKNPKACIEAETPAEGEEPGDHSPKAVFHKKMEVIKKALMINNRNIAQESKWIDQVKLIMKQYDLKMKKVSQHIGDERKAIKELLRQRRIILNEKKQKELELKLKMATQELAALADAESQVKQKSVALSNGKSTLSSKISVLTSNLEKLRTDKNADEQAAAKKADF